jgi:acyl carrier protein
MPAAVGRAEVVAHLRGMYAEALEYPEEAVTEDAELEADLGVDSVKQTELFVRLAQHYGLPTERDGRGLAEYGTIGKLADLVSVALSAPNGTGLAREVA